MALLELDKPFILRCDVSYYTISLILSQKNEGKKTFNSRDLKKHEKTKE